MRTRTRTCSPPLIALLVAGISSAPGSAQGQSPAPPPARAVIERAIAGMGGEGAIRRIDHARFETATLWHRFTFEDRPFGDAVGAFERGTELRDYLGASWRHTRRFIGPAPTAVEIVDVVQDTVAARMAPTAPGATPSWAPLSVAYVDEREELFALAPERLLLAARDAADLRSLPDTTIDGDAYARVSASITRVRHVIHLRRSDGLLAFTRFRAAQPRDFGLAPLGRMDVEVWYSRWQLVPLAGTGGIGYPLQMDVSRVGRPYKRVTILAARFDVAEQPDSFAVSPALREAFFATASVPMWAVSRDSARIVDQRFAQLGQIGPAPMAVVQDHPFLRSSDHPALRT